MGGGNVSFGHLYRRKDSSGVNEKRFAFLRKHQPPGCPVQKLGPEAALQSRKNAGHAGGGQTGLGAYRRKSPQINGADKNREVGQRMHIHDFLVRVFSNTIVYLNNQQE
jgi:hypothetical protein